MSDQAALLAAIHDNPEDDSVRLAYADWLDEQGGASNEAWAEYIRLEIQHERDFPEFAWSKVKEDAQKRAWQLFRRYADEWFPAFFGRRHVLRGASAQIRFRRGFPHEVYAYKGPSRLIEIGEKVLQLAPITRLVLNNVDDSDLDSLLEEPWLSRLHSLDLYGYDIPQTDWCTVASCPHLKQLRELMLYYGTLTPENAAWIAKKNPCPRLKRLHIGFAITDAAIAGLFGGKAFAGLEELELDTGKLGPEGLKTIASVLKRLKSLKVSYRKIPGMAKILTRAAFWPRLEELEVVRCGLGNAGLGELVSGKHSRLRTLRMDYNNVTSAGALALAASPVLASLTKLDISNNKIGDTGVAALVGSPKARNLRELDVSECKIGPAGIIVIAQSPHLANLRELWLSSNNIDLPGAGARRVAAPRHADLARGAAA